MKFLSPALLCIALIIGSAMSVSYAGPPKIIVTLKPLHSLVAAVTDGVTEPQLLLDGYSSPHFFQLKPSAVRAVHDADMVVWVGEGMESFLIATLHGLSEPQKVIKMAGVEGLKLLPLRERGFHDHGHESPDEQQDEPHGHNGGQATASIDVTDLDNHFWLDPDNARLVVGAVAEKLALQDPENAATYQQNALRAQRRLSQLAIEVEQLLADSHDKPFLVFHDSFQYFENRFNLSSAGVISIQPDAHPSAQRIRALHQMIADSHVECLFSEPQFKSRSIKMLVDDTDIKHAVVDPLGSTFDKGPEMYFDWMSATTIAIRDCFVD